MIGQITTMDGGVQRLLFPGELVTSMDTIRATDTNVAITVTGAILLNSVVLRSGASAMTDTIDTAENIRAAVQAATNGPLVPNMSWRVRWIETTANTATLTATANTGVTVNRGVAPASGFKDFSIRFTNTTPAQIFAAVTTNASAVLTGMSAAQTALLAPGMVVLNAVAGLQGTTIISVQQGVGVTMSGNANATNVAPGVSVTFSPVLVIDGLAP